MSTFLVVRVTDVEGAPVDATVTVSASRAPLEVAKTPGAGIGVYEARLPPLAKLLEVRVERAGLAPVVQSFMASLGGEAPALSLVEPLSPWVRTVALTSRGPVDQNLDVHVYAGTIQDGLASVLKVASRPPRADPPKQPLSFPPRGKPKVEVVPPSRILVGADAKAGPGETALASVVHHTMQPVVGAGRTQFLARPVAPWLVGLWVPPGLSFGGDRAIDVPFHVHLRSAQDPWTGEPYAVSWPRAERLHHVLYTDRLAYQHELARKRAVLAIVHVPAGDAPAGIPDPGRAQGLSLLLQEIAWWLARAEKSRWPRVSVGRVAVSASGRGLPTLERLLADVAAEPEVGIARRLGEIYVLGGPTPSAPFVERLAVWRRGAKAGERRIVRIYHRERAPWEPLLEGRAPAGDPDGPFELHGANGTLVVIPPALLAKLESKADQAQDGHFPALFAGHALSQSGFAAWEPQG